MRPCALFFWAAYTAEDLVIALIACILSFWAAYTAEDYIEKNVLVLLFFWAAYTAEALSLTIVATNELHDFNHVLGCNYEKDLHLWIQN